MRTDSADQHDPTDAAAIARVDRQRAVAASLAERTELADLTWLMDGKRGRRIVWRLLDSAGVFRLSFSPDALQMAFAEGCRNEGLRLLKLIQLMPAYAQMLAECAPRPAESHPESEATP